MIAAWPAETKPVYKPPILSLTLTIPFFGRLLLFRVKSAVVMTADSMFMKIQQEALVVTADYILGYAVFYV